jgi:hypothetical protein
MLIAGLGVRLLALALAIHRIGGAGTPEGEVRPYLTLAPLA